MRILICMCILSGVLAAQDSTKTSPPPAPAAPAAPAAKQTKKAPAASGIPKDAVETTPGFYRWTDKDGKVWTYRRTPFGVTRWPAESVDLGQGAADKRSAGSDQTTAVEQGDSIRFEQTSLFGKRTWVRKKTELNESEQRIWDLQQKNSTASHAAEKE
jgi:hypothetical protein